MVICRLGACLWYFQPMSFWIDTHCHLDAPEFAGQTDAIWGRAVAHNVRHCVIPAVEVANFDTVRLLAHQGANSYALGIHPLYVQQAHERDLEALERQLHLHQHDSRLVAVGEIGLDFFVPALNTASMIEKQEYFYARQLQLARKFELPVILHVRRSADRLLKHLRAQFPGGTWRGIAHAFNGSDVQAREFVKLGLKLGFGGASTFERALQLRRLAVDLPLDALVMETDAPDIPPKWLYRTASERLAGQNQGRNEPAELPRIAAEVAALRGISPAVLATATTANAVAALPRLAGLLPLKP